MTQKGIMGQKRQKEKQLNDLRGLHVALLTLKTGTFGCWHKCRQLQRVT